MGTLTEGPYTAMLESAVANIGSQFGPVVVVNSADELTDFDLAFVPWTPQQEFADTALLPCPAIAIDTDRKSSTFRFTKTKPVIESLSLEDLAFGRYTELQQAMTSFELITAWRHRAAPVPKLDSIALIEDTDSVAFALIRQLGNKDQKQHPTVVWNTVAHARANVGPQHRLIMIDGSAGSSYAETDALTAELLAQVEPPVIFRFSGRVDLIKQPGHGTLWKPGRDGEIANRTAAILDWLGKPLHQVA